MITGYFGSATRAGVMNVQNDMNLPQTGYVDGATRAAISQATCLTGQGGYSTPVQPISWNNYNYTNTYPNNYTNTNTYPYNNSYTYPYNYNNNYNNNTNCYYTYPYTCNTNTYSSVTLTSLSPTSGQSGTSVNLFGTNFDYSNNTVYFGNQPIANIPSYNGTSLTVTVPSNIAQGTVGVYVTNSRGTSNTMTFTTTGNYGCGYPYTYGSYNYNNSYCPSTGTQPIVNSVTGPTSLSTGTTGTWTLVVNNQGNSYLTTSVNWGDASNGYVNASAPQTAYLSGTNTLTFTHAYYAAGTYNVVFTLTNASGQQTSATATVVVSGSGTSGNVTLAYLSPTSGHVGTQIMLQGSGFNALDNTVHFGIGGTMHVPSVGGTTIYYTIPAYVSPCDVTPSNGSTVCAQNIQQIVPGPVQVYVTNSQGTSQTLMFQVTY